MKCLCISGATSPDLAVVTTILQQAGLQQALPATRDGSVDIAYWHEQVIAQSHVAEEGEDAAEAWEQEPVTDPGRMWEQLASDIFLANIKTPVWGWADPNSTWLLDFWLGFDPRIKFILVCTTPEHVIARAMTAHESSDTFDVLMDTWQVQHEQMLRFYHRNPGRCLLVDASECAHNPAALIERCVDHLKVPLTVPADFTLVPPDQGALTLYLAAQIAADYPHLLSLKQELASTITSLGGKAPINKADALNAAGLLAEYRILRDRSTEYSQIQQAREELASFRALHDQVAASSARLQTELETKTRERDQEKQALLAQLQKVQSELQALVQKHEAASRQTEELIIAKAALEQDKAQLAKAKAEQDKAVAERDAKLGQLTKAGDEEAKRAAALEQDKAQLTKAKAEQDKAVSERDAKIGQLTKAREEQDKRIAALDQEKAHLCKAKDDQDKAVTERDAKLGQLTKAREEQDKRVTALEQDKVQLSKVKADLDKAVAERDAKLGQLTKAREEQDKRIAALEQDKAQLTKAKADQDKAVAERDAKLAQLTKARDDMDKRVKEQDTTLAQVTKSRDESDKRAKELETTVAQLSKARAELSEQAGKQKAALDSLTQAKLQLDQEKIIQLAALDAGKSQLNEAKKENERLLASSKKIEDELNALAQKLEASTHAIEELNQSKAALEQHNTALIQEKAQSQKLRDEQAKGLTERDATIAQLSKARDELAERANSLKTQNSQLTTALNEQSQQAANLKAELDRLTQSKLQLEQESAAHLSELEARQAKLTDAAQEHELLLAILQKVQDELSTLSLKVEADARNTEALNQAKAALEQDKAVLEQEKAALTQEKAQLLQLREEQDIGLAERDSTIAELSKAREDLAERTSELDAQIFQLTNALNEQTLQAGNLKAELDSLTQAKHQLEQENTARIAEVESGQIRLSEVAQENDLLQMQLDQVRDEMDAVLWKLEAGSRFTAELSQAKTSLEQDKFALEQDKIALEQDKATLEQDKTQLLEIRDEQAQCLMERDTTIAKLTRVREELDARANELEAQISQLTNALDERASQAGNLQAELEGLAQAKLQLEQENVAQITELESSNSRLSESTQQNEVLQAKLRDVQDELGALALTLEESSRQTEELIQAKTALEQDKAELLKMRDEQAACLAEHEATIAQLFKVRDELDGRAREQELAILQMTKARDELAEQAGKLKTELDTLAHGKAQLEQEHATQVSALKASQSKLNEAEQESELLLLQLHQVQEAFEALFLNHEASGHQIEELLKAKAALENDKAQLTKARSDQDRILKERDATIIQLNKVRDELDKLIKEKDVALAQLTKARDELAKGVKERDSSIAQFTKTKAEQEKLIKERDATIVQLTKTRDDLDSRIKEKDAALAQLTKIRTDQDRRAVEHDATIAKLTKVRDELDKRTQEQEIVVAQLTKSKDELASQAGKLRTELDTLARTQVQLEQHKASQTADLKESRTKLKEAEQDNELLLLQLCQVQEELEVYFMKYEFASRQADELIKAKAVLEDDKAQLTAAKAQQDRLLIDLDATIAQLTKARSDLHQSAKEREVIISELTKVRDEQTERAGKLKGELDSLTRAKVQLEKEKATQAAYLKSSEGRLEEEKQASELLLLQLHQVQEELETLFLKHEADRRQAEELIQANTALEKDKAQLLKAQTEQGIVVKERDAAIVQLTKSRDELNQRIKEREATNSQLTKTSNELEKRLKGQEGTLAQMTKSRDALNKRVEEREATIIQLNKARDEILHRADKLSSEIESLTRAKIQLEEEKATHISQLTAGQDRLKKAEQANELLSVTLQKVQREMDALFVKHEAGSRQAEALTQAKTALEQDKVQLLKVRNELEIRVKEQKATLAQLTKDQDKLDRHAKKQEDTIAQLTASHNEKIEQARAIKAELDSLVNAQANLQNEKAAQGAELKASLEWLKEAEQKHELVKLQLQQVQDELAGLFLKHESGNRQAAELKQAKAALEVENAQLTTVMADLGKQVEDREATIAELSKARDELDIRAKERATAIAQLSKVRDEQTVQASKLKAELDSLIRVKAQLEHEKAKFIGEMKVGQDRLKESEQRYSLLLLQQNQVQEELQNNFITQQETQKQLRAIDQRWRRMLQRNPDYCDFASIAVLTADVGTGATVWRITELNAAGRSFSELNFGVQIELGFAGISFTRKPGSSGPLLRWPLSAATADDVQIMAVGTPHQIQARKEVLLDLSTGDWDLLAAIISQLTAALEKPEPLALPEGFPTPDLYIGMTQLGQILNKFPDTLRFDTVSLQREQVNHDYEHLWLHFNNLSFGKQRWPVFEFRLSCANLRPGIFGKYPKLEFPETTGEAPFNSWFAEAYDDFGAKLELRFALPDSMDIAVWKRLSSRDQAFLKALISRLPAILATLAITNVHLQRPWQDWTDLALEIQRLIALHASISVVSVIPPVVPSESDFISDTAAIVVPATSGVASAQTRGSRSKAPAVAPTGKLTSPGKDGGPAKRKSSRA